MTAPQPDLTAIREPVVIELHVEATRSDYSIEYTAEEWAAMTPLERGLALEDAVDTEISNSGGAGWHIASGATDADVETTPAKGDLLAEVDRLTAERDEALKTASDRASQVRAISAETMGHLTALSEVMEELATTRAELEQLRIGGHTDAQGGLVGCAEIDDAFATMRRLVLDVGAERDAAQAEGKRWFDRYNGANQEAAELRPQLKQAREYASSRDETIAGVRAERDALREELAKALGASADARAVLDGIETEVDMGVWRRPERVRHARDAVRRARRILRWHSEALAADVPAAPAPEDRACDGPTPVPTDPVICDVISKLGRDCPIHGPAVSEPHRPHTPELVPSSTPGRWRTVCTECSDAAQDYVSVCTGPGWTDQIPGELMAAPVPGGEHVYLSTFCFHGTHDECGAAQHARGDLKAPHCKECPAPCICPCHEGQDLPRAPRMHTDDRALADRSHLGWCGPATDGAA